MPTISEAEFIMMREENRDLKRQIQQLRQQLATTLDHNQNLLERNYFAIHPERNS